MCIYICGGVFKWGIPEADGLFHGKANIKMDAIWGVHFRKSPYVDITTDN